MVINDEEARKKFSEAAVDGKISCAKCFRIAEQFDLDKREIADTLTEMGIKIVHCQLGCFP
jgi:hypothetical protein